MSGEVLGKVSSADPEVLDTEIAEQLRLLREDKAFRDDVAQMDVDLDEIDALLKHPKIYEVVPPANHFGGVAEGILIKIAVNVGTTASIALATLIWQKVIKPSISKGSRDVKDES